jgi:WXG100 family type VII secretion target
VTAEALREAARSWRAMGKHLQGITQDLDQRVRDTRETHWRGPAADAFGEQWTRLKGSVDEAVPVFELAAAGLDDAADRAERTEAADNGGGEAAPAADNTQLIMQIAYAGNMLSQLGAQLGGSRKKQGSGRGRPSAPTGPLPTPEGAHLPNGVIGVPVATVPAKEKPSGGLGIAAGARTPAPGGPDTAGFGAFG